MNTLNTTMYAVNTGDLITQDPALHELIQNELRRQHEHLELIASENYVSRAVLEAQGSVLTNKYAEGYPGHRYYGGCAHVDDIENLAIERAQRLFEVDYVNVQPHSGSQANAAVFMALLEPGDLILGMSLSAGGHLTHGTAINFSGRFYRAIQYGVDLKTGLIDYDQVRDLAIKHKPRLIIAGFSAYSRALDWSVFRAIADEVGAYLLVDMAHLAGLVAGKVHSSPVPWADVITSTTHKTLRGPRGGLILAASSSRYPQLGRALNRSIFPGTQGGPLMHTIAAKAVCFQEALAPAFKIHAQQVVLNAKKLAKTLSDQGFEIVSGGTDNHLFLVDLSLREQTGQRAEIALGEAHITLNKNSVPGDRQSPLVTSGIRLGTPALTTRGLKEQEMEQVGRWIAQILNHLDATDSDLASVQAQVREEVQALCTKFRIL